MRYYLLPFATLVHAYLAFPFFVLVMFVGGSVSAFFLIMLSTLANNVAGLYTPLNYLLFCLALLFFMVKQRGVPSVQRQIAPFVLLVAMVQLYGLVLSIAAMPPGATFHMLVEPLVSTIFAVLFPVAGAIIAPYVIRNESAAQRVLTALLVFIGVILLLQAMFGGLVFVPASNLDIYSGRKQLSFMEESITARLFGPTLGPNALGLWLLFAAVFLTILARKRNLVWQLATGAMAVITYSKSAIGTIVIFIVGSWFVRSSLRYKLVAVSIATLAIVTTAIFMEDIIERFRVGGDLSELGTRSLVYEYMLHEFPISDYVTGIGPYSWKAYFAENLGMEIQDPHSFLFSVPGGYGFAGIALYLVLGWAILVKGLLSRNEKARIAAVGLLTITFIKDIATIPLPLGTTHFTFLYWLLFAMMLQFATQNENKKAYKAKMNNTDTSKQDDQKRNPAE